jgi:hypothetical protein
VEFVRFEFQQRPLDLLVASTVDRDQVALVGQRGLLLVLGHEPLYALDWLTTWCHSVAGLPQTMQFPCGPGIETLREPSEDFWTFTPVPAQAGHSS